MREFVAALSFIVVACGSMERGYSPYYPDIQSDMRSRDLSFQTGPRDLAILQNPKGAIALKVPPDLTPPPDLVDNRGEPCYHDKQCLSNFCDCSQRCHWIAAHCFNGVKDEDESWIDCGGVDCHGCPDGYPCDTLGHGVNQWNNNCTSCQCKPRAGSYTCCGIDIPCP